MTATHKYLATLMHNASGSYADAGQLKKIKPPKVKWGKSNTSHLASTGKAKTSVSGWVDVEDVDATIYMIKTDVATLMTNGGVTLGWKVRYNDGTTATTGSVWAFSGYICDIGDEEISDDDENPIMTSIKICVSGVVTFTAAT